MPRTPAPFIVWTDNQDDTGGTVAIGNHGGGTYQVFVSRFGGQSNRQFQEVGTIIGVGTLAIPGTWGPIAITAIEPGTSTVCNPVFVRITDGELPLHQRCALSLRDFVLQLNLPQLPQDEDLHKVVKLGAKLEKALADGIQNAGQPPACLFYIPQAPKIVPADNQYDSVTYPVVIAYMVKRGHATMSGLSDTLDYREKLTRAINACNMLDIPEVHTTTVTPGVINDVGKWQEGYDASVLTVNFTSEQIAGGID